MKKTKSQTIQFRVTEEIKERVTSSARGCQMNVGDYLLSTMEQNKPVIRFRSADLSKGVSELRKEMRDQEARLNSRLRGMNDELKKTNDEFKNALVVTLDNFLTELTKALLQPQTPKTTSNTRQKTYYYDGLIGDGPSSEYLKPALNFIKVFYSYVYNEVDAYELTVDEIERRFGDLNEEKHPTQAEAKRRYSEIKRRGLTDDDIKWLGKWVPEQIVLALRK